MENPNTHPDMYEIMKYDSKASIILSVAVMLF